MPTYVCLMRHCQLFLIETPWSYSKLKGLLDTLNGYEIPAKRQLKRLLDTLNIHGIPAADEISVSKKKIFQIFRIFPSNVT